MHRSVARGLREVRLGLLVTTVVVAIALASCGRATPEQINQALGITPTPTLSAEQMATATAAPGATAAARTALAQNPATPGDVAAVVGNVSRGQVQFLTNCTGCHRGPSARGGDLLAPGGIGATVTFESLLPLIRQGDGHVTPPGPIPASKMDDAEIHDLVAFIRSNAAK